MTSGNISGAPICREDTEAISQLGHFCDCILSHDRRIRIRADDSVMDFYQGEPYMIRFDSEFGDKEAMEGSDIHALHFLRKTSVTPITVDMTKR